MVLKYSGQLFQFCDGWHFSCRFPIGSFFLSCCKPDRILKIYYKNTLVHGWGGVGAKARAYFSEQVWVGRLQMAVLGRAYFMDGPLFKFMAVEYNSSVISCNEVYPCDYKLSW